MFEFKLLSTQNTVIYMIYVNLTVTTHKKSYSKYAKEYEKGNQTYCQRKSSKHKLKTERKGTEKNYKNDQKTFNKMAIST